MADSPERGVVDRNCKVHGVDNLFVAGSSVFPTSGQCNPTLTIVALALRLGDELKRSLKPGARSFT
jgi:choline dehydrogenase-like flavoprotein